VEISVSDHAVGRYQERVRSSLDIKAAEDELLHVLRFATVGDACPEWAHEARDADEWALLGDGIAFPLKRGHDGRLCATTCLTRAGMSDSERASKSAAKRRARERRRNRVGEAERNRRWGSLRVA
jgi:hypothetical protein